MIEGNLSLNSPNFFAGNPLHDVYCCTKCKPMDESCIWSILTDTLQYVKAEVDSSVTYSFDQKRFQNTKSKYFDQKSDDFSNKNTSIDKNFNAKKENFDAANYNVPNVPIYSQQLFQTLWKIDMEICLYSQHHTSNLMRVYVQLISGQRIIIVPKWKVRLMT